MDRISRAKAFLALGVQRKSIIMIAFFLTMPISSTIPISPIMLESMSGMIKAISAPTPAERQGREDGESGG